MFVNSNGIANTTVYEEDDDVEETELGISLDQIKKNAKLKSMRSMSRSTFDSIIDDFIEDDWEKKSAFGVSLTVVGILTIFLTLLGVALSVSLGVQHGNQSKKLAFILCSKASKRSLSDQKFSDSIPSLVS